LNGAIEQDIQHFWSILFELLRDVEKRLAAHMALHGLTPPQFFVLKTLVEHDGCCPIGQIAREHHLTNATMTGLIKRLELMQPPLVARERSLEDARSVNVVLTPAGEARFEAIKAGIVEQLLLVFDLISPEERRLLLQVLARYMDMFAQIFPIEQAAG
jgi:DNA-binding MarR family transcriptional regulator